MLEQQGRTFVIFQVSGEEYGLDIDKVQSIVRYEAPTPVPRCPESVMGVVNLRGQVIPVVDVARRLGREPFVPTATSRIIVAEGEAGLLGLAVDAASEVAVISPDSIQDTPESVLSAESVDVFEGVAERDGALVILLNLDRAVPGNEYGRPGDEMRSEGGGDV